MNKIKSFFSILISPIKFIQNHFKAMIFLLIVFLIFSPKDNISSINNLQQINLYGAIMDSAEVVKEIDSACEDSNIKGVLLNINSPGGAVAPSVEIAYAIKRLKDKKPVIAYASGTMASGSYYASIWADKIIANPGSMIGSIGVIMQGANISKIMQTIGIQTQTVRAGKYKEVGTNFREWTDFEKKELNKIITSTYNMFTQDVANARKLDINARDDFANAHIFTSIQAKNIGLIDSVGVMHDAKKELQALSKVKKAIWNKENAVDKIIKKLSASVNATLYTYFPTIILK